MSELDNEEYDGDQNGHEDGVDEPETYQVEIWVEAASQKGQEKPGPHSSQHPNHSQDDPRENSHSTSTLPFAFLFLVSSLSLG